MKLSHQAESFTAPSLASQKYGPLAELYKNVLEQFQDTRRNRDYGKLWGQVAPSGNIYRYNGLAQERMRHCLDLDRQLEEVAEEHAALLGGLDVSLEQRCRRLVSALSNTRATGIIDDAEGQDVPEGFLPLEEFLDTNVTTTACVVHPADGEARSSWFFNHLLAFVVFTIQAFGPLLVVMQLWHDKNNHLKNPTKMWNDMTFKESLCLGKDRTAILTTVMGTLFLLLINIQIYNHCRDECSSAAKMGRLPTDNMWSIMGNLAQCMCSVFLVIAVPLEFWREDGITGIMMNSMAMMFVFTLDDLTGDVFGWLGDDDNDFQQQVCWNYALLAYCPVTLRDLINPTATKVEDIWKISYDANGHPRDFLRKLSCDANGRLNTVAGAICETRIMAKRIATESTPLVHKDAEQSEAQECLDQMSVHYRVGPATRKHDLPGIRAKVLANLWSVTKWIIAIIACSTPIIWFALNKPCRK